MTDEIKERKFGDIEITEKGTTLDTYILPEPHRSRVETIATIWLDDELECEEIILVRFNNVKDASAYYDDLDKITADGVSYPGSWQLFSSSHVVIIHTSC